MSHLIPFKINIPQSVIDQILNRVRQAEIPGFLGDGSWDYGVSHSYMQAFITYWIEAFDWYRAENMLNEYPQFIAEIDGYRIHFYHVRGSGANSFPLLLTHGWPGSIFEFIHVIDQLTHPEWFGGNPEDAFDVIIPSLPGFGFSSKPKHEAIGLLGTARLWEKLMTQVLNYQQFGAQGGDFGAEVSTWIAHLYPDKVVGLHLNMIPYRLVPDDEQSEIEKAWWKLAIEHRNTAMDYLRLQMRQPQTLSFALMDNPVGVAAWILEKFKHWSDSGKDLESTFTMEQLLTNIMIYLTTKTIDSSLWFYRGWLNETGGASHPGEKITVPTGVAAFPKEMISEAPPKCWIERDFNLIHYTQMPRGGHFACLEQPQLFVEDVQKFFRLIQHRRLAD